jgi:Spy/CpxP family protein refolding chaperone
MNGKHRRGWLAFGLGLTVYLASAAPLGAAVPESVDPMGGDLAGDVRAIALGQGVPPQNSSNDLSAAERAAHAADTAHPGAEAVTECDVLAEIAAHAGPVDSQKDRKHKWWSSDEGRAEFGLTEAQSRDLEAVFQQVLPEMRIHKADVDRYQQQLTKLLSEASAKESVVVKAIEQLEAAQSALSRTRTIMLYRMYRLLSPEQRTKVQAYYERKAKEQPDQSVRR